MYTKCYVFSQKLTFSLEGNPMTCIFMQLHYKKFCVIPGFQHLYNHVYVWHTQEILAIFKNNDLCTYFHVCTHIYTGRLQNNRVTRYWRDLQMTSRVSPWYPSLWPVICPRLNRPTYCHVFYVMSPLLQFNYRQQK